MSKIVLTSPGSSGGGEWGTITGTLSDQTDLQTALDLKLNTSSFVPGGNPNEIQYNNGSGAFAGFGNYAASVRFLGIEEGTPQAIVDVGTFPVSVSDVSVTSSRFKPTSSGYALGSNSIRYYIYAFKDIEGSGIFAPGVIVDISIGGTYEYDVMSANVTQNFSGSGYTESGQFFSYEVWAVYDGLLCLTQATTSISVGSTGDPFSNDITWSVPNAGEPDAYYVVVNSSSYTSVAGNTTSAVDDGSWSSWSAPGSITAQSGVVYYTAASDAAGFVVYNSTADRYIILPSSELFFVDQDGTGWSSGSPAVTPTVIDSPSLYTKSSTQLIRSGLGKFSIFGAAPVGKQTGDIAAALNVYGFVDTPILNINGTLDGTLPVSNGGTGVPSMAANSFPFYTGASLGGQKLWASGAGIAVNLQTGGLGVFHAHRASTNDSFMWATNAVSGTGGSAGFKFGIDASANAELNQLSNLPLIVKTNNTERMRILSGGNVGVGTATPNSTLESGGSFAHKLTSTATSLTLTGAHTVVAVTAACTITFPTAVGITGRMYTIKSKVAATITIATTSSQTIDGAAPVNLTTQWAILRVISDGANWLTI